MQNIRPLIVALGLALLTSATSSPALGQPRKSKGDERPSFLIFVSPAGEAFRALEGPYPSRTWFDLADSNRDGRLTAGEMVSNGEQFFRRLDRDVDGRINGEEIRRYETEVTPEVRVNADPRGPGGLGGPGGPGVPEGPGGPGGRGGSPAGGAEVGGGSAPPPRKDLPRGAGRFSFFDIAHPILRADVDLSGSVTLDEFRQWQRQQFAALDQGQRGFVMFEQLPRTPAQGRRIKAPRAPASPNR